MRGQDDPFVMEQMARLSGLSGGSSNDIWEHTGEENDA